MKFSLLDITNSKSMRVHQAFVRLSKLIKSVEEKQLHEVIFVAEPDASNIYKFEMPVGSEASTFGYYSGEYDVDLIVGDAVLNNSFQWRVATVDLKFPEQTGNEVVNMNKFVGYSKNSAIFTPKSEIKVRIMSTKIYRYNSVFIGDNNSYFCYFQTAEKVKSFVYTIVSVIY